MICSGPRLGATVPEMTTLRHRPGGRASTNADEPVYRLDVMTQADVPDVSRVERRCFANPWPASAYRRELQNPAQNHYVVLRELRTSSSVPSGPAIGLDGPDATEDAVVRRGPVPRRSLLPIG